MAGAGRASMRPRPDAAENAARRRVARRATRRFNEAAARCRGKRSWATDRGSVADSFNEAAARCRGKLAPAAAVRPGPTRFNEAAARCRGKRRLDPGWRGPEDVASMRPRPDAAENACKGAVKHGGLNLASMRPRPDAAENARRGARRVRRTGRFNEAAARCRGKPVGDEADRDAGDRRASMRPRPDAAENFDHPSSAQAST